MLLRPLFGTAFLLDDELADDDFGGAETLVISSASSKTALATAFLISRRDGAPSCVGLTSPSRVGFVEGTDVYSRVVSYDDIGAIGERIRRLPRLLGRRRVREAVHGHYGDDLVRDTLIGVTHWDQMGDGAGLPGAEPIFFFAPTRAAKRPRTGAATASVEQMADAWDPFVEWAATGSASARRPGLEPLETAYLRAARRQRGSQPTGTRGLPA